MPPKLRYELSSAADEDLESIFDYTHGEYGFGQAEEYLMDFESLFGDLLANPELGRERNEIKMGLRSIAKNMHTVFYRILADRIRIVRVLHTSQDIPRLFD